MWLAFFLALKLLVTVELLRRPLSRYLVQRALDQARQRAQEADDAT
jgi:hypothetical protein